MLRRVERSRGCTPFFPSARLTLMNRRINSMTNAAWGTGRPQKQTLAGQNPSFDRDFVKAACKRAGIAFPFAHRTIDTHTLAWLHMTEQGIPPPLEKHHS